MECRGRAGGWMIHGNSLVLDFFCVSRTALSSLISCRASTLSNEKKNAKHKKWVSASDSRGSRYDFGWTLWSRCRVESKCNPSQLIHVFRDSTAPFFLSIQPLKAVLKICVIRMVHTKNYITLTIKITMWVKCVGGEGKWILIVCCYFLKIAQRNTKKPSRMWIWKNLLKLDRSEMNPRGLRELSSVEDTFHSYF